VASAPVARTASRNGVEDRQAEVLLPALARRHAADHFCGRRRLPVRSGNVPCFRCETLAQDLVFLCYENVMMFCYSLELRPLHACRVVMSLAENHADGPLSASIFCPSSTLVPSRRTNPPHFHADFPDRGDDAGGDDVAAHRCRRRY